MRIRFHFHHRRRRRHPKVLWQRERRSSSLGPRQRATASRTPRWTQVRNHMAVGLPAFVVLIGNAENTFKELLSTEESFWRVANTNLRPLSHEGRWQCLRTTSCRLSEVSDSLRGLGWLAGCFASSCQTPFLLEDWLRPPFFAVGDGNHSGNRRGGLGQGSKQAVGSGEDHPLGAGGCAEKLTISAAVEPTPLSGFRSQGAQWSPRGRSDVIGRCRPLCELVLTWPCRYKCFSGDSKVHTWGTFMSSRACPQPIAHVATGHFQIHSLTLICCNFRFLYQRVRVTLPSWVRCRRFFVPEKLFVA